MPHPHPKCFPPGSGTTQRRTPTGSSKPNLKLLVSKKGRSICRKQNLVRERALADHARKGLLEKAREADVQGKGDAGVMAWHKSP